MRQIVGRQSIGHHIRPVSRWKTKFLRSQGRTLSWAEKSGGLALVLAGLLFCFAPLCAAAILAFFIVACLLAPMFPGWGFFYPVLSHGPRDLGQISLSFDDGPDPVTTPALLALLRKYGFCAIFFVTGRRARRYPDLIRDILKDGHELGNHSYSHEACIMFRSPVRLFREMALTQRVLMRHGVQAVFFRPPVGVNVPAYAEALHASGLEAVNFSCRARDMGNRRLRGLAERILSQVRSGDIVLLHDTAPRSTATGLWLTEVETIFNTLKHSHMAVVPLTTLCQRPDLHQDVRRTTAAPKTSNELRIK